MAIDGYSLGGLSYCALRSAYKPYQELSAESAQNLWLVFEYRPFFDSSPDGVPETMKMSDVEVALIISRDAILVIGFTGTRLLPRLVTCEQIKDYQTRLKHFHAESSEMMVSSLIVIEKNQEFIMDLHGVRVCSTKSLPECIKEVMGDDPQEYPDIQTWLDSDRKHNTNAESIGGI